MTMTINNWVIRKQDALNYLFANGETGDYWVFDNVHTDAATIGAEISSAIGLANGLNLSAPDMSHTPNLTMTSRMGADFDGSADRLRHAFGSTIAQPGTIIICVFDNATSTHGIVTGSAAGSRWQISVDSANDLIAFASAEMDSGQNAPIDTKVLTVEYNGASSRFRINGTQVATGNVGTQGTNQLTLGAIWDGTFGMNGKVYGLLFINRILTGAERDDAERFLGSLVGLTWSASDEHYDNTVLLLSMDGANGSTTFTDQSAAARGNATVTGNAQVVTSIKKFGTGSLRVDGVTDDIKFVDHADWTLGTSDFTIEGWFLWDSTWTETTSSLITHYSTTSNQRGWILQYTGSLATNALRFVISTDGSSITVPVSGNWTPAGDTWYHLCVERSGTTFRIYVDGVMLASGTSSGAIFNSTASMIIGETANGSEPLKGNVDEFRFTLGVARYASDAGFAVPTEPYPRG